jgi:chaperone modulatory protein CbpM
MRKTTTAMQGMVLDERLEVTLTELTRLCGASDTLVRQMVGEGLLRPQGRRPEEWHFSGIEIRRARRALRLQRELELDLSGAALAIDLLDEIETLRARIRALEYQLGARD